MARYYITEGEMPEVEVTKADFVAIERREGFHNTTGEPDEPATGGFGSHRSGVGVSGRIASELNPLYAH